MSSTHDWARAALAERRPGFFLTLAPTTSASYPQTPSNRTVARVVNSAPATRRRSSSSGFRVLKLAPVHWGEHVEEHQEDFYEVAETPASPQSSFLSLAPTVSASYPRRPAPRAAEAPASETAGSSAASSRRSSSSSTTGFRVLKLGPVYYGEHADDHKADFHDVMVPISP